MLVDWDVPFDMPLAVETSQDLSLEDCLLAGSKGVMIDNEHYHSLAGISGSNLTLLAESNLHLDNKSLFNLGTSPALEFGTLLHTFVLEPAEIDKNYAVMPTFNLRTNDGKQQKMDFISENAGKITVTDEDYQNAAAMAKNVMAICGDVIDAGIKERSLFADVGGVVLKCRLDCDLESVGDDFDLKSITLGIKGFSDVTLEQHIKKFNYHRSAALRNITRRTLGLPVRDSYLIFSDTGGCHMVRVIKMHPEWIASAENDVNELLEARRFYLATKLDRGVTVIDDRYRI